jgi:DNA polymerase elongation subunit (family B)
VRIANSTFYEKDIAASTTATGRSMIVYAKRIIEEVYENCGYDTVCHGPVLTNAECTATALPVIRLYTLSTRTVTKVETIEALTISELGSKYGKTDGLS